MIREIITYPNKKLKEASKDVKKFDKELHLLLDDMYETMVAKNGIGLAAIQIAIPLNALLILLPDENDEQKKENLIEVINPRIINQKGSIIYQEGCLSVPDYYDDVKRAEWIEVEYYDRFGNKIVKEHDELLGVAFQHEMDHLRGHLFIERLSYLKRKKFDKEWKKRERAKKK